MDLQGWRASLGEPLLPESPSFLGAGTFGAVYGVRHLAYKICTAPETSTIYWREFAALKAASGRLDHLGERCPVPRWVSMTESRVLRMERIPTHIQDAHLSLAASAGSFRLFAASAFAGLAGLHRAGFQHCDIKYNNMMLRGATVVFVDFSVARPVDAPTWRDRPSIETSPLFVTDPTLVVENTAMRRGPPADVFSTALALVQVLVLASGAMTHRDLVRKFMLCRDDGSSALQRWWRAYGPFVVGEREEDALVASEDAIRLRLRDLNDWPGVASRGTLVRSLHEAARRMRWNENEAHDIFHVMLEALTPFADARPSAQALSASLGTQAVLAPEPRTTAACDVRRELAGLIISNAPLTRPCLTFTIVLAREIAARLPASCFATERLSEGWTSFAFVVACFVANDPLIASRPMLATHAKDALRIADRIDPTLIADAWSAAGPFQVRSAFVF